MTAMIRTQVYLPQEIYEELQRRSKTSGIPMARQIRQALEEYLEHTEAKVLKQDDPIWQIVGAMATEHGDLSIGHDKYIYGWDKSDENLR